MVYSAKVRVLETALVFCVKLNPSYYLRCSQESGNMSLFPAAMPPGWPSAPLGSRRTTNIDQLSSSEWLFLYAACICAT
jgi:hypothetical protein